MALKDLLNIVSGVSVIRTISTNDGMGGYTTTSTTSIIPLCAIWANSNVNRFISDKYLKDSTHQLVYEWGSYTFDTSASTDTVIETITYNGETYKRKGFSDDVMNLHEIVTQALERIS
jgi:hypothetical protein